MQIIKINAYIVDWYVGHTIVVRHQTIDEERAVYLLHNKPKDVAAILTTTVIDRSHG